MSEMQRDASTGKGDVKIVLLILSAAHYEERRQACRDTWMKHIPDGIEAVFLTGGVNPDRKPCRVEDVVVLPCRDDYPSLPQKTRNGIKWALDAFPAATHVVKLDDDTFIHMERLLEYVATNPGDYCGHEMTNEFPSFMSGGAGYLLSREAAVAVADGLTDKMGCEDLLVAHVLRNAKFKLTPCSRFHPWNSPVPTLDNDQITAHYMTPDLMRKTWANLQGQKIPKIFHWIWIGGKPIPEEFRRYIDGWLIKHPGWRWRIWNDDQACLFVSNKKEYATAKTLAQKADILRYEILLHHGGVYLDCDFECFKNIEPLIQDVEGFSAAEDDSMVAIGIMGCVPGHPLYGELIQALPASFAEYENVVNASGPGFFTRHCLGRKDFKILPPWTVYPRHWSGALMGPMEAAYADHKWSHSWRS